MLTLEEDAEADESSQEGEPIPREILAAIAAAAVFMGRRLHIRAVELLPATHERASRWSRQGRVTVQMSHNLAVKHGHKAK